MYYGFCRHDSWSRIVICGEFCVAAKWGGREYVRRDSMFSKFYYERNGLGDDRLET